MSTVKGTDWCDWPLVALYMAHIDLRYYSSVTQWLILGCVNHRSWPVTVYDASHWSVDDLFIREHDTLSLVRLLAEQKLNWKISDTERLRALTVTAHRRVKRAYCNCMCIGDADVTMLLVTPKFAAAVLSGNRRDRIETLTQRVEWSHNGLTSRSITIFDNLS